MELNCVQVAKLVLGYLKSENCPGAYNEFIGTSRHLKNVKKSGKFLSTRIFGLSLIDIVKEYAKIYTIVQERLEETEFFSNRNHSKVLTNQLLYLLDAAAPSRCVSPNLASRCSTPIKQCHCGEDPPTEVNTTPLTSLPGHSGSVSSIHHSKDSESERPVSSEDEGGESGRNRSGVKAASILAACLVAQDELTSKLAENINDVFTNAPQPPDAVGGRCQENRVISFCMDDIDNAIKMVMQKTESDPAFDSLMNDVIMEATGAEDKENYAPTPQSTEPPDQPYIPDSLLFEEPEVALPSTARIDDASQEAIHSLLKTQKLGVEADKKMPDEPAELQPVVQEQQKSANEPLGKLLFLQKLAILERLIEEQKLFVQQKNGELQKLEEHQQKIEDNSLMRQKLEEQKKIILQQKMAGERKLYEHENLLQHHKASDYQKSLIRQKFLELQQQKQFVQLKKFEQQQLNVKRKSLEQQPNLAEQQKLDERLKILEVEIPIEQQKLLELEQQQKWLESLLEQQVPMLKKQLTVNSSTGDVILYDGTLNDYTETENKKQLAINNAGDIILYDGTLDSYMKNSVARAVEQPVFINRQPGLLMMKPTIPTGGKSMLLLNTPQYVLSEQEIISMPTVIVCDDAVKQNEESNEVITLYQCDNNEQSVVLNGNEPIVLSSNTEPVVLSTEPVVTTCKNEATTSKPRPKKPPPKKKSAKKKPQPPITTFNIEYVNGNEDAKDNASKTPEKSTQVATPKSDGKHVRALDFNKFNTPPKDAELPATTLRPAVNKTLFKTPVKKVAWDSDLRATANPLPITTPPPQSKKPPRKPPVSKPPETPPPTYSEDDKPYRSTRSKSKLLQKSKEGAEIEKDLQSQEEKPKEEPMETLVSSNNEAGMQEESSSQMTLINCNTKPRYKRKCNIESCRKLLPDQIQVCMQLEEELRIPVAGTSGISADKTTAKNKKLFLTPDITAPKTNQPISMMKKVIPMLETPIKETYTRTPDYLSPPNINDTPITKVFKEQMQGVDISSIPTPSFPLTPNFPITPFIESPYSNRPTDYSTSSSYYQPSDSEQNKSLEAAIIKECSRLENKKATPGRSCDEGEDGGGKAEAGVKVEDGVTEEDGVRWEAGAKAEDDTRNGVDDASVLNNGAGKGARFNDYYVRNRAEEGVVRNRAEEGVVRNRAEEGVVRNCADEGVKSCAEDVVRNVASGKTKRNFAACKTTQSLVSGKTKQSLLTSKTSQSSVTSKTAQSSVTGKTTQSLVTRKTTQGPVTRQTTHSPVTDQTTQSSAIDKMTQSAVTGKTTQSKVTSKTTQSSATDKTTQSSATDKTTQSSATDKTTQSSATDKTRRSLVAGKMTQSSATVQMTHSLVMGKTTQSSVADKMTQGLSADKTTKCLSVDKTVLKLNVTDKMMQSLAANKADKTAQKIEATDKPVPKISIKVERSPDKKTQRYISSEDMFLQNSSEDETSNYNKSAILTNYNQLTTNSDEIITSHDIKLPDETDEEATHRIIAEKMRSMASNVIGRKNLSLVRESNDTSSSEESSSSNSSSYSETSDDSNNNDSGDENEMDCSFSTAVMRSGSESSSEEEESDGATESPEKIDVTSSVGRNGDEMNGDVAECSEMKGDAKDLVETRGDAKEWTKMQGDAKDLFETRGDAIEWMKIKGDAKDLVETRGDAKEWIIIKSDAKELINTKGDSKELAKTKRYAKEGIKTKSDTKKSIKTKSDAKELIKTKGDAIELIETKDDAKESINTKGDLKELTKTKSDAKESIKTKIDAKESIKIKSDAKESINMKGDSKELAKTKSEAKESIKTKSEVKESIKIEGDAIELIEMEDYVKESIYTKGDSKELTKTTKGDAKESIKTRSDAKESIKTKGVSKESVKTKGDAKEPIKMKTDAKELIKTKGDAKESIKMKGDALELIETEDDAKESIKTKSDAKELIKTKSDAKESIKTKSDAKEPIKMKSDAKEPIKMKGDAKESIKTKSDAKEPIKMKSDAKEPIKMKGDAKESIKTKGDALELMETEDDAKEPIKTKSDAKESIKIKSDVKELAKIKSDAKELAKIKSDAKELAKIKSDASESIKTKSNAKESINTKGDARESIKTKSDAKEPIKMKGEALEPMKTKGDAKESIKTKGGALELIETEDDAKALIKTRGVSKTLMKTKGDSKDLAKTRKRNTIDLSETANDAIKRLVSIEIITKSTKSSEETNNTSSEMPMPSEPSEREGMYEETRNRSSETEATSRKLSKARNVSKTTREELKLPETPGKSIDYDNMLVELTKTTRNIFSPEIIGLPETPGKTLESTMMTPKIAESITFETRTRKRVTQKSSETVPARNNVSKTPKKRKMYMIESPENKPQAIITKSVKDKKALMAELFDVTITPEETVTNEPSNVDNFVPEASVAKTMNKGAKVVTITTPKSSKASSVLTTTTKRPLTNREVDVLKQLEEKKQRTLDSLRGDNNGVKKTLKVLPPRVRASPKKVGRIVKTPKKKVGKSNVRQLLIVDDDIEPLEMVETEMLCSSNSMHGEMSTKAEQITSFTNILQSIGKEGIKTKPNHIDKPSTSKESDKLNLSDLRSQLNISNDSDISVINEQTTKISDLRKQLDVSDDLETAVQNRLEATSSDVVHNRNEVPWEIAEIDLENVTDPRLHKCNTADSTTGPDETKKGTTLDKDADNLVNGLMERGIHLVRNVKNQEVKTVETPSKKLNESLLEEGEIKSENENESPRKKTYIDRKRRRTENRLSRSYKSRRSDSRYKQSPVKGRVISSLKKHRRSYRSPERRMSRTESERRKVRTPDRRRQSKAELEITKEKDKSKAQAETSKSKGEADKDKSKAHTELSKSQMKKSREELEKSKDKHSSRAHSETSASKIDKSKEPQVEKSEKNKLAKHEPENPKPITIIAEPMEFTLQTFVSENYKYVHDDNDNRWLSYTQPQNTDFNSKMWGAYTSVDGVDDDVFIELQVTDFQTILDVPEKCKRPVVILDDVLINSRRTSSEEAELGKIIEQAKVEASTVKKAAKKTLSKKKSMVLPSEEKSEPVAAEKKKSPLHILSELCSKKDERSRTPSIASEGSNRVDDETDSLMDFSLTLGKKCDDSRGSKRLASTELQLDGKKAKLDNCKELLKKTNIESFLNKLHGES